MESRPLVVVGAGIAGTTAAIEAARAGVQVTLVDENPISLAAMGLDVPLFFGRRTDSALGNRAAMLERVIAANDDLAKAAEAGVEVRIGTCVWGAFRNSDASRALDGPQLGLADDRQSWTIKYDRLIVASGARDLGMPFAGSELAGAMGANGAHSLMRTYEGLASRRMVILGSGNLGLNIARMALMSGVEVAAVVDVAPAVRGDEALEADLRVLGVEFHTSHTVKEASGADGEIESVVLVEIDGGNKPVAGSEKVVDADTVCLAVGLVPNVELPSLLGCDLTFRSELGGYVPDHDEWMRTSVDDVFVAGDAAGFYDGMVQDPEIAVDQGRLAGIAAAESLGALDSVEARTRRSEILTALVDRPTDGPTEVHSYWKRWLESLVNAGGPDVFVCRCEEVTCAELIGLQPPRYLNWASEQMSRRSLQTHVKDGPVNPNHVKRLTRVGTGHCQGRLCREQVSMLVAEESGTAIANMPMMTYRPPVRPLPLKVMWPHDETEQVRTEWPKWFHPPGKVLG